METINRRFTVQGVLTLVTFSTKNSHVGDLEAPLLGTWDTILVILGSRGTPNGHTEAQMSIFSDFRLDLGSLLGPTLGTIL